MHLFVEYKDENGQRSIAHKEVDSYLLAAVELTKMIQIMECPMTIEIRANDLVIDPQTTI